MEYTKGFLSVTDKLEELLADGSRQSLSDAYRLAVKHTHLAAECAQTIVESIVDCKDGSMRKNKLSVLESLSVRKEFQEFIIELFPILIKSFESLPRLSFSYARGLLSILNSLGPEAPAMFSSFYSKLESVIASNGVSATMSSEDVVNQKRRATVLNTIDMTRDKYKFLREAAWSLSNYSHCSNSTELRIEEFDQLFINLCKHSGPEVSNNSVVKSLKNEEFITKITADILAYNLLNDISGVSGYQN